MKDIVAYTSVGSYPPYINISADQETVRVIVRSPAKVDKGYPECGDQAAIVLPRDIALGLLKEALEKLK